MIKFFAAGTPILFKINRWSYGRMENESGPVRVLEALLGPNHNDAIGACVMAESQPTLAKVEKPKQCVIEGCGGGIKARGYCNRHYLQVVFYGREPIVDTLRSDSTIRDAEGRKKCTTCGQWMAELDFHKAKKSKDGRASSCAECYRTRYTEKVLQRHGLTKKMHDEILAAQGERCICGDGGPLVIDHDHSCCPGPYGCAKCVRGLICHPCNKSLGFARDDAEVLRKLAGYVEARGARL